MLSRSRQETSSSVTDFPTLCAHQTPSVLKTISDNKLERMFKARQSASCHYQEWYSWLVGQPDQDLAKGY